MLIFLAAAALALLTAYWIIRSRGKRPREDGAVPVLAEVVAVETKSRDTADGLRNSPAVLLTLEFSFDGAGLRRQLEWQHGRAVKPGDKLPLLYEPLTGRRGRRVPLPRLPVPRGRRGAALYLRPGQPQAARARPGGDALPRPAQR